MKFLIQMENGLCFAGFDEANGNVVKVTVGPTRAKQFSTRFQALLAAANGIAFKNAAIVEYSDAGAELLQS